MCSDPQCGQTKTTLRSCYVTNLAAVCCNLPTLVPSHSITTVTCTSHTRTNSTACTTVVFTFSDILCDNTLRMLAAHILPLVSFLTLHCLALQQHWLQAQPSSASSFWCFGQSRFICPNSPHAKHLILLASHCYNCCYGYGSPCTPASLSAASTIFPRSIGA